MKLYVLYEQTCDGESNHRYFTNEDNAQQAYEKEFKDYKEIFTTDFDFFWKVSEVETED